MQRLVHMYLLCSYHNCKSFAQDVNLTKSITLAIIRMT